MTTKTDTIIIDRGLPPQVKNAFAPFQKYIDRGDIKEIIINKPNEVFVENAKGEWKQHHDPEMTASKLRGICRIFATLSNQTFNAENPIIGFKFPDGSRVQVLSDGCVENQIMMAVRVARDVKFELEAWSFTKKEIKQLQEAVKTRQTILIAGGTSTGKTSLLNALTELIPMDERLVTIEGVPELKIPHPNVSKLFYSENETSVASIGVAELVNCSLRIRPDRILMGEIRKENAYPFCHAINTGHEGSLATIHCNEGEGAIEKVVNYAILQGHISDSGSDALLKQLRKDIKGVVHIKRIHNKMHATYQKTKDFS